MAPWWCGTIIATKSVSTSPDGLIPISIIIFVIALTFSARYGASAEDAEPNDFAQIAET
jgi:hypothetical protein